jgi:electron transfer flavoprotein beta subunit
MRSRKKEIRRETLDAFGTAPRLKVTSVEIQVKERLKKILNGKDVSAAASQLVQLLRNEARVIS